MELSLVEENGHFQNRNKLYISMGLVSLFWGKADIPCKWMYCIKDLKICNHGKSGMEFSVVFP